MPTQTLFPTLIYRAPVQKSGTQLHKELLKEAYQLREKDQSGQHWSKSNYARGFTTYGSLDELHQFSSTFDELRKKLDPHVRKYLKQLGLDIPHKEIRLTKMWVNVMGKGCTHGLHLHPLSTISGSYYVQMPKGCSAIKFEDPRMGLFMARPPIRQVAAAGDAKHPSQNLFQAFQPKPGDVILFESWLRHEVPPHEAKLERVSISFNYDWTGV